MSTRTRQLAPFLLAFVLAFAAIALRVLLEATLGHVAPLMVFVLAVVVASILGGLGPGLTVSVICSVAMVYELEPRGVLGIAKATDQLRVVLFLVVGAVSATLGERRLRLERTARVEAERAREALARE
nr:DUF4118 domain-containing protein [Myxococcota bacterium]